MTDQLEPSWEGIEAAAGYTYIRPLVHAAHQLIADARNTRRVFLGIEALDRQMRGLSAGHLALLNGYSHSGKTQFTLHILRHNADKRVLVLSPDEPGALIIMKLASAASGMGAEELEARVRGDDPAGMAILHETIERYPGLVVVNRSISPRVLNAVYDEVCDMWGAPPDLVVFDFLDLLQGGDGPMAKAEVFKAFTTEREVPLLLLHQVSRMAGSKGQRMAIDSGSYGGETHATFVLGVRRKKAALLHEMGELEAKPVKTEWTHDRLSFLQSQLLVHQYTLTLNMSKNKRPGGQPVDEIDMELWLDTGVLSPLHNGDLPVQYRRGRLRAVPDPDPYKAYGHQQEVQW